MSASPPPVRKRRNSKVFAAAVAVVSRPDLAIALNDDVLTCWKP